MLKFFGNIWGIVLNLYTCHWYCFNDLSCTRKAPATTDTVSQPETSTNTATNSSSSSSTTPKYETYDFGIMLEKEMDK